VRLRVRLCVRACAACALAPWQTLQYFKTAKSVAALGTIALHDVTQVRAVAHECSAGGAPLDARFELKTHARTFVLGEAAAAATSAAAKRAGHNESSKEAWVAKLREVSVCLALVCVPRSLLKARLELLALSCPRRQRQHSPKLTSSHAPFPLSSAWREKLCGLPAFDLGPCGGRLYSACVEPLKVGLVFGHRTTAGSAGAFVGTAAVRPSASSGASASAADDDVSGGAVVLEVAAGSAAEGAGVRAGDRLHRIQGNDVPLKTMSTFAFHTVGK